MATTRLPWTPWHQVVRLRDDVRSGSLSLEEFAADLYDVKLARGRRMVYEDPRRFFALTYPTTNLRDLARDVALRLAGRNAKAIRQLELTYGGGKTHALITHYHLHHEPAALPDIAAVREFRDHIGIPLPRARIAVLPFDKIDAEKGLEDVPDPTGKRRTLLYPWSILAWQIAGAEGLKALHPQDKSEERDTPPAEPLLEKVLRLPQKEGLGTLVLIDEVLMYGHVMVQRDPRWLETLKSFFQYLCNAVVKADRAALVASVLATDPAMGDELGRQITRGISDILARDKEEGVQPVMKEDVAEVLRRRFFTPESIERKDDFRAPVFAALEGIGVLDETTRKDRKRAEERFVRSYPFHPELTEVFYGKWTNLESFQKTRGVLRTFALALRDAEKWDQAPLVGPNVFLAPPAADCISEAARELTSVASREQTEEGGPYNWTAILEGELHKARDVQEEFAALRHREMEQAVFATFIHSQPARQGAKARLDELLVLIGATRPDKITLEKALRSWFERSWFLDESAEAEVKPGAGPGAPRLLPVSWRLGARPNLRQMHADARTRIPGEVVEARLLQEIRKLRTLTAGAGAAGATVHLLPGNPADVGDDGSFHYAVLGPAAASEPGRPSGEARRFIDENTGPHNPRKERNAIVLAVPSKEGLFAARQAIVDHLAWEEVGGALRGQAIDPVRAELLTGYTLAAQRNAPGTIAQAYCIGVTVSEADEVQAFKVNVGDRPLFLAIKEDRRSRIQDTAITADAILPGGPYDLWRAGEDSRPVRDIVGAFARFPRLPKMMNRQAILDTIVAGCVEGVFAGRLIRPDRSVRTFWRQRPEQAALGDANLEIWLPEKAILTEIDPGLLAPGLFKELWSSSETAEIAVGEVRGFFGGGRTVSVNRGDYEESLPVPSAATEVVDRAIAAAVEQGRLWLTSGPASLLGEEVPPGLITEDAVLQAPPAPISVLDLVPERLPDAWRDDATTAMTIAVALSRRHGRTMPWVTVREAIESAFRSSLLERIEGSAAWPCEFAAAGGVRIRIAGATTPSAPPLPGPSSTTRVSRETDLNVDQIQDLADVVPDLRKATAGYDLAFRLRVQVAGKEAPSEEVVAQVNQLLRGVCEGIEVV